MLLNADAAFTAAAASRDAYESSPAGSGSSASETAFQRNDY